VPSINEVRLLGHLVKKPEMKYTPNGNAVSNFTIATSWGSGDKRETEFNNCVIWDGKVIKWAAQAAQMNQGDLVLAHGRLRTRSWDQDGMKRYRTEIQCDSIHWMRAKGSGQNNSDGESTFPGLEQTHQATKDVYEEPPF
jgi:single-strand DNA-binding protein